MKATTTARLALLLVLNLGALGCPDDLGLDDKVFACSVDSPCADGFTCLSGVCVKAGSPAPDVTGSSDTSPDSSETKACEDDCPGDGESECTGENLRRVCGVGASGCLEWGVAAPCTLNDAAACIAAACVEGACGFTVTTGCYIDEVCYSEGQLNPETECSTCALGGDNQLWTPLDGTPSCSPDDCLIDQVCNEGECTGGKALACEGGPCVEPTCVSDGGCQYPPKEGPCDDNNACTDGDSCSAGTCQPGEDVDCNDKNPCTNDSCDPVKGCQAVANQEPCDDKSECTAGDVCVAKFCVGAEVQCDDGKECTEDKCDEMSGCLTTPVEGACEDGSACTVNDACADGECVTGDPKTCDDNNPCTADTCDVATGCVFEAVEGSCDDLNACTADDVCQESVCAGQETPCDDGQDCTEDSCNATFGCQFVPIGGSCNDGNACTNDVCTTESGCTNPATPNVACDDESQCTVNDTCNQAGDCGGTQLKCEDDNECTQNGCAADEGCVLRSWCATTPSTALSTAAKRRPGVPPSRTTGSAMTTTSAP